MKSLILERNKKVTERLKKIFIKTLAIEFVVCGMECAMLGRLFSYIEIGRIDLFLFTMAVSGFFAMSMYMIWENGKNVLEAEMRAYRFYLDCAYEHTQIPYYKAKVGNKHWIYVGKAKDFDGFKEATK